MAFLYVDTDGSGATSPYDTWAKAAQTLEAALEDAACVAGSTVFMQGLTDDSNTAALTLTSAGTKISPVKIIGVKDGTTNTGTSVVAADLTQRGDVDIPHVSLITTAGIDLAFEGSACVSGIKLTSKDRFQQIASASFDEFWSFSSCHIAWNGLLYGQYGAFYFDDCDMELLATGATMLARSSSSTAGVCGIYIKGGVFTFTAAASFLIDAGPSAPIEIAGADLSGFTGTALNDLTAQSTPAVLKNCRIPAGVTIASGTPSTEFGSVELIGCDSDATHANTDTVPDYQYSGLYGTIDAEFTVVRTGGADDGGDTGAFAYALTPGSSATLEGTHAALKSPWMAVWLDGGAAKTLTVHITSDADLNEDEVWCEFYTPDSGDTATYEQTFDPALARLLASTTAITTETATWGGATTNDQKMSITVTPGYTGWAYARLHYAKRNGPVLYLDPKIEVT